MLPPLSGAVDILNVRFSEMESMQRLGDASTTLGLIFAAGGCGRHSWCGCQVGPQRVQAGVHLAWQMDEGP